MTKDIQYNGHTANPSDYASLDGDLAVSMGAIVEDGALRPVLRPKEEMTFPDGAKVLHIHETAKYRHFIYTFDDGHNEMHWKDADGNTGVIYDFNREWVKSASSLGNTLIVMTEDSTHYLLWKEKPAGYRYLGEKLPELQLSFGLQGETMSSQPYVTPRIRAKYGGIRYSGEIGKTLPDGISIDRSEVEILRNSILGSVNTLYHEKVTNAGKFCCPFFVRYAYRLYDGTLSGHSAPILMYPSNPFLSPLYIRSVTSIEEENKDSDYAYVCHFDYRITAVVSSLDYQVVNSDIMTEMYNWEDIIKSVEIFISAPIFNFDQNGEYILAENVPSGEQYFVGHSKGKGFTDGTGWEKPGYFKHIINWGYATSLHRHYDLSRSEADVYSDLASCHDFYQIKSINSKELAYRRTELEISGGVLRTLQAREVMTDDYMSHDVINTEKTVTYNRRLNLIGVSRKMFHGFTPLQMFPYTDRDSSPLAKKETYKIYVELSVNNKSVILESERNEMGFQTPSEYLYYPDSSAKRMFISVEGDGYNSVYAVSLRNHDFLNGAFYPNEWRSPGNLYAGGIAEPSEDVVVKQDSTICTSEVNNPFVFPAKLIASVGSSSVKALAIANQALSPLQFGQYPMYAFTNDGVWVLNINNEGAFEPARPINNDVLINDNGILSLDNSVIYPTARGLMLLSGSQSQCISDTINAENLFSIADLPRAEAVMGIFRHPTYKEDDIFDTRLLPFLEFVKGCQMLYDYVHQHILIFNSETSYAYVYSLKSKAWGMTQANGFEYVVPSVGANAYAMMNNDGNNTLYDYSKDNGRKVKALVISRPIKFDLPFDFKTVDTVIQRGQFQSVQQILYATNDFVHWVVVWSSVNQYMRGFSGTPYKAYRIVFITYLNKEDNIYGCTMQYTPRLQNQPR